MEKDDAMYQIYSAIATMTTTTNQSTTLLLHTKAGQT